MLLFDENISHRVATIIAKDFPGALHIRDLGLLEAPDSSIWEHAKHLNTAIVSKDDDFLSRALLHGYPPKVIILKSGNCPTHKLITFIRERQDTIRHFLNNPNEAALVLGP